MKFRFSSRNKSRSDNKDIIVESVTADLDNNDKSGSPGLVYRKTK